MSHSSTELTPPSITDAFPPPSFPVTSIPLTWSKIFPFTGMAQVRGVGLAHTPEGKMHRFNADRSPKAASTDGVAKSWTLQRALWSSGGGTGGGRGIE